VTPANPIRAGGQRVAAARGAYHGAVTGALTGEIRDSLAASRAQADRILSAAETHAQALTEMAAETDQALIDARMRRLHALRAEIEEHQQRIESAYVGMAEAMAKAAVRLAEAARDADFSAPPWPAGIRTAFELKLSETREMTIRIERDAPVTGDLGSRLAAIEEHGETK
jgi:hypothetical protein